MLRFSLAFQLTAFAGGHRGVVTPVPIPNTEVKGSFAEGSAGLARARVGRRRLFYFLLKLTSFSWGVFFFFKARFGFGDDGVGVICIKESALHKFELYVNCFAVCMSSSTAFTLSFFLQN